MIFTGQRNYTVHDFESNGRNHKIGSLRLQVATDTVQFYSTENSKRCFTCKRGDLMHPTNFHKRMIKNVLTN